MAQAAASTKFLKQMRETYEYFYDVVTKDEEEAYNVVIKLMKPNTENAKCSSKQDEHRIREAILSQGGFGVLDEIVFHLRKKLVIDEFLHHAVSVCSYEAVLAAVCTGTSCNFFTVRSSE